MTKEEKLPIEGYQPDDRELVVSKNVFRDVELARNGLYAPRVEFNDLNLVSRDQTDWLAFNTYQPNDGEPDEGDIANSWRSNAIRPIERNKCISVAGHAAGRMGFVRATALNENEEPDEDASLVINRLLDYVRYNFTTDETWLRMIIQAEVSPACIVHESYTEVYRDMKTTRKADGSWNTKRVLDPDLSGFQFDIIPTDQLLIPNVFESDIQKQRFVAKRRIISYDIATRKYSGKKNFEFVRPGFRATIEDGTFYYSKDDFLSGEMCEEITYWTKEDGGSELVILSGIIIGDCEEPLKRKDGLYPLAKFGYELIRPDFFYYKSLVFKISRDANILNTLYPVMVDGAILDTFPPTVATGSELITSDVIIPGVTTTITDPNARLQRVLPPLQNFPLLQALGEVEKSLSQTVETQAVGMNIQTNATKYQIQVREQEIEEAIGPFKSMMVSGSIQLTRLVIGDIIQHLTIADVSKMTPGSPLIYKQFNVAASGENEETNIRFEELPDEVEDMLEESYKTLKEQGGLKSGKKLMRVNPKKMRELNFKFVLTDDILKKRSQNVEFANNLETFDKAIMAKGGGANLDLDKLAKDLLFSTNPKTAKDPSSYILKEAPMPV